MRWIIGETNETTRVRTQNRKIFKKTIWDHNKISE